MARIRTIKPEFWTDEHVVELSAFARLLFIGLWNFADDDGRMVYSPKRIKMQVFPADDVDISGLFGELRREGRIAVYAVDGVEYLAIANFAKHQKVDKRTASKIPAPPDCPPIPPEIPRTVPTEGNGMEGIKEGNGKEERGADAPPAPVPSRKAGKTKLPLDWQLPDDWREYAVSKYPGIDADAQAEHFRDRQLRTGETASDWKAAWRMWLRKAVEFGQVPKPQGDTDERLTAEQEWRRRENLRLLQDAGVLSSAFRIETGKQLWQATKDEVMTFIIGKRAA